MGVSSFLLCAPEREPAPFGAFEGTWAVEAAHLVALREALRLASVWLRREWRPDFTLADPFGPHRHLTIRRRKSRIAIVGPPCPMPPAFIHDLEFHYVELPVLRAGIERYIWWFRHHSVTTPGGTPDGTEEVRPDR